MGRFLRLVVILAILGGGGYLTYSSLYKEAVSAPTPDAKSDLKEKAKALHGKRVVAKGTLTTVAGGPESGPRLVVKVTSLEGLIDASAKDSVKATVIGTRKGLDVTAKGHKIHLNAPNIRFAPDDGGAQAVTSGPLSFRAEDGKQLLVLTVQQYSTRKPAEESVTIELQGTLDIYHAAIGGETTGTVIKVADRAWEIDLSGR